MIKEILELTNRHEKWRGEECLNLIPSENVMSPAVRKLLSSELGHRYTARSRFYMGTEIIDSIEQLGEKAARRLFQADVADLRPLSGHIADLIFLGNFTKPDGTFMCIAPQDGGYPGIWKEGLPKHFRLRPTAIPFSKEGMRVDTERTVEIIQRSRPDAIILGASLIVFPHPVSEITKAAREVNVPVGFDGSHVLGLIAGGQFQDPLREGADILFGSTHKSLFGPQGGIILAKKEIGERLKDSIYPAFVDNAHWNRIAALALALREAMEFGKEYAEQVISNSKTLAKALYDYGFPVICAHLGFTESHQAILNYGNYAKGRIIAERLERANIIADCAVRLGTCEITRRGMKEEDTLKIAELIKRTIIDEEKTSRVRKDVAKLCREHQEIEYCFQQ